MNIKTSLLFVTLGMTCIFCSCSVVPESDVLEPTGGLTFEQETPASNPTALPSQSLFEDNDSVEEAICPINLFGVWRNIDFMPNAFLPMGSLQPYKYKIMAFDMIGKEIEYQHDFYRYEEFVFDEIEYIINELHSEDYDESELLYILNYINQMSAAPLDCGIDVDTLYIVWVKGVEEKIALVDIDSDDYESIIYASATTVFVIINEKYIYHTLSGLLSEKVS